MRASVVERRSTQAPSAVIMVRPHHFTPNTETAADNAFQRASTGRAEDVIAEGAYQEVTAVVETLRAHGVQTHLFEDETTDRPDAVFPNNWFSTHPGGHVALYPMFAPNRRRERRYDIIEMLKREYRVQDIIDYSGLEPDGLFLEGTGAMVLDHLERVAYATRSNRTDPIAMERFCTHFNYEPMVFDAKDEAGRDIYHTNVLMCIATEFVLIGSDLIIDSGRKREIIERFEASGRRIIGLSNEQIAHFAGNAMELQGADGRLLALSQTAFEALDPTQIETIESSVSILPLNVPTIELAGGSIRCMMAGVHLSAR